MSSRNSSVLFGSFELLQKTVNQKRFGLAIATAERTDAERMLTDQFSNSPLSVRRRTATVGRFVLR